MDQRTRDYIDGEIAVQLEQELLDLNMSRLRDKLSQAKGVVKRVSDDIEAAADDLIAREAALLKGKDAAFAPHLAILSDARAGLDELEQELRQFSNSDPLESSESASGRPAVWSVDSARKA